MVGIHHDGGCQYWPVRGPERFAGPWNATLEWPMLIVSNPIDPITPIQSGLRINSLMPGSTRLIIQDGPGHCSTATPTLCTRKLVREYYAGILRKWDYVRHLVCLLPRSVQA
ncbi:hypothetical protein K438DRAFT_1123348 [Mycena galopus ATCC 62051]|nr:hypothetical protein K438DRAFT_1123348 [Mycena galopus ATCC 62051]